METRKLGRTSIELSPVGLGAWQFSGGQGLGAFWGELAQETVREVVRVSLENGVSWIDTAEIYGGGRSEEAVADALDAAGARHDHVRIATKWFPLFRFARSIERTAPERLRRLGGWPIALHQVHMPTSFSGIPAQMRAMASLARKGQIGAVGVSNFSQRQMRLAHAVLADLGVPLASNQVQYNLLSRAIERNGVLDAARELGVTIIAYSPLAQGLLTGKYQGAGAVRPRDLRRFLPMFGPRSLARHAPLVGLLTEVGRAHGVTPAQIALAWLLRAHGEVVVAIPGARSVEQARSNAAAMGIRLSPDEIRTIGDTGLIAS